MNDNEKRYLKKFLEPIWKCKTWEQIIGILKEHDAGFKTSGLCRWHGYEPGDILQMEVEVRREGKGQISQGGS